jgi:hypothetical protein
MLSMPIPRILENKTLRFWGIIAFLIVDLILIGQIIDMAYYQLSYQQYQLATMITAHPENATYYINTGEMNQAFIVIVTIAVFVFLAIISDNTIKLLKKIVDNDKASKSKNNQNDNDEKP